VGEPRVGSDFDQMAYNGWPMMLAIFCFLKRAG
jgi:hypothetical protein